MIRSLTSVLRATVCSLVLLIFAACGGGGGGNSGGGSNAGGNNGGGLAAPSALSYSNPQNYIVGTAIAPLAPTVMGTVTSYTVAPALPVGIALNPISGVISGTPAVVTPHTVYTVTASNAAGAATFSLTIFVGAAPDDPPSNLSYSSPQSYTVGSAIAPLNPTVTGTVSHYGVTPALPPGLTLDEESGQISGTPNSVVAQATYTVSANNSAGSTTFELVIEIKATVGGAPSSLSYASPQTYLVGVAVVPLVPAITGIATRYSVSPALPPGLNLNAATGQITGTPIAAVPQTTYTVVASNDVGSTSFDLIVTVSAAPPPPPTELSYASPQTYTVGTPIAPLHPSVTGTVTSFSVTPALPDGLVLNSENGQITGTPTAAMEQGTYTITASNGAGSTTFGLAITIDHAAPMELSYPSPQMFTVGTAIAPLSPTVTGVVTEYSVAPALPTGLSLNTATGEISGTPTVAAPQTVYTITASNNAGNTAFDLILTVEFGPAEYTIGGTVSGLDGIGLVLTSAGRDELEIASDGAFIFDSLLPNGASYVVEVTAQPSSDRLCKVANAIGTIAGANVTDIEVTCALPRWGTAELLDTRDGVIPQLAMNPNGSAIAIWSSLPPGSPQPGGRPAREPTARHFSPAGGWGPLTELANTDARDPEPHVTMGPSGSGLAIWVSRESSQMRLNTYSGAGWSGETQLDGGDGLEGSFPTDQLVYAPRVAVAADGSAIAVWARSYAVNPNVGHVFARRYTVDDGWGPVEIVSNMSGPDVPAVRVASIVEIAMDGSGNATVVWTSQQYDNGYRYDIYANRYTVGEGWGNASLLSSPGAYYVDTRAPGVVASSDGGAIAVWSEAQTAGIQPRITSRRYVPGSGWDAPIVISNQEGNRFDISANLAGTGNGSAIAVWMTSAGDGQPVTLYSNRYDPTSGWGTPEPIRAATTAIIVPGDAIAVDVNEDGIAFAAWIETAAWAEGAEALGLSDVNDALFTNMWASRYIPGQGWDSAEQIGGPDHLYDGTADGSPRARSYRIKVDAQGRALAVWHYISGQGGVNFPHKIWANRFE